MFAPTWRSSAPPALAELRGILEAPAFRRTEILRALTARPAAADLATLIAMTDTCGDEHQANLREGVHPIRPRFAPGRTPPTHVSAAPGERLELSTYGLTVRRSAN
jgi:hypothetical protein